MEERQWDVDEAEASSHPATVPVALTARVYYRNAVAELDADLNAVIRRRDNASVEKFPKVTRTGPAGERIFEGMLPDVLSLEKRLNAAVDDALEDQARICPGSIASNAVSACVGALISSREKKAVNLPVDPESDWGKQSWPIS